MAPSSTIWRYTSSERLRINVLFHHILECHIVCSCLLYLVLLTFFKTLPLFRRFSFIEIFSRPILRCSLIVPDLLARVSICSSNARIVSPTSIALILEHFLQVLPPLAQLRELLHITYLLLYYLVSFFNVLIIGRCQLGFVFGNLKHVGVATRVILCWHCRILQNLFHIERVLLLVSTC